MHWVSLSVSRPESASGGSEEVGDLASVVFEDPAGGPDIVSGIGKGVFFD
jgi:hypothetical protein